MPPVVVITAEGLVPNEAAVAAQILEQFPQVRIHLRKPGAETPVFQDWMTAIPQHLRARVSVHGSPELAKVIGCGGVHGSVADADLLSSCSTHSMAEAQGLGPEFAYAFLSPIFDSISKVGYGAAFSETELVNGLSTCPVPMLALGGISAGNADAACSWGFVGVAALGWVWDRTPLVSAEILHRVHDLVQAARR